MHHYQLQKYNGINSRYRCPQCLNRRKTLTLYIDTQTKQPLNLNVGICDRANKCGYHYTPKQYFAENKPVAIAKKSIEKKRCQPSVINHKLFKQSLSHYHNNNLINFLMGVFGTYITQRLISRYLIGTSKHWPGATVFWQIDALHKIRSGKIMLYNASTCKRVKQPFNHIAWVHKVLKMDGFELRQCFFGEHLLPGNNRPVAIVESEKAALIASVYLPDYVWLAAGSLNGLTDQKCSVLKNRRIYLFPDLNGFDLWQQKATQLSHIAKFTVSNTLQQLSRPNEKLQGLDIADYLLQFIKV